MAKHLPAIQHSAVQSFVEANEELDCVCKWLEDIGIGFSVTRVGKYKRIFTALAEAQQAGDLTIFYKKHSRMDFLNAVVERAQLIRIYEGLEGINDFKLVERIKKAVRSHALFVMDDEHRSGRDFSLELDVAAKFFRSGYEIDFGHDADVKASKDGFDLFVECKRLRSEDKIRENIKIGLKQLKNRYKSSADPSASRGLLVLSISKILNPAFGYLEGENIDDIGRQCSQHADAFAARYSRYWRYTDVDKRSLGVAIFMDAPGQTTERGIPFSLHEVAINNIVEPSSPDSVLLAQISKTFEPRHRTT